MGFNIFKRKKEKEEYGNLEAECGEQPKSETSVPENLTQKEDSLVENAETAGILENEGNGDSNHEKRTRSGFLNRLKKGLSKTRDILTTDIDELFLGRKNIDEELLEDLEAILITSDVGLETTEVLMDRLAKRAKKLNEASQLKKVLKEEILSLIKDTQAAPEFSVQKPHVIMVVGVNGVGKTTTIGKLASRYESQGKKTLIAAADTFRAAAIEQLGIWAERAGCEFIRGKDKADPASVAFDAITASIARKVDVVIIDTAGRLHTNVNLMEEVRKIKRAVTKKLPEAPHEVLLILDASTGQNALSQANLFNEAVGITGLALTKLDGTAKGGIVISICNNLNIPLQYVGIGEKLEDIQDFVPEKFVEALL